MRVWRVVYLGAIVVAVGRSRWLARVGGRRGYCRIVGEGVFLPPFLLLLMVFPWVAGRKVAAWG